MITKRTVAYDPSAAVGMRISAKFTSFGDSRNNLRRRSMLWVSERELTRAGIVLIGEMSLLIDGYVSLTVDK